MKSENQQRSTVDGLQIPGLVQNADEVEQLDFGTNPLTPPPLAAPVYENNRAEFADVDTAARPISHAGITDTPLPQTSKAGDPYSLAGLDTARGPIAQRSVANTPLPQTSSDSSSSDAEKRTVKLPPGAQTHLAEQVSRTTRALLQLSQAGLADTPPTQATTASRPPVLIHSSYQQKAGLTRPPQGRRHVISIAALILLVVITGGTLLAVSPLGREARATLSGQSQGASIVQSSSGTMNLVAQATATAVVHQQNDGYDPAASSSGAILTGSPESWPFGVCTYWANLRYHELTGHWVTWLGNAYQWVDGARLAGWHVSTSPHVPSIIVLMPGVEGASSYGHVAVVESASGNVAHTSNMNWYANGGSYGVVSYYDFTAGSGVYFIWE